MKTKMSYFLANSKITAEQRFSIKMKSWKKKCMIFLKNHFICIIIITATWSIFKGTVHPKMKILSLIAQPHVVQTHKTFVHLQNTNEDIFVFIWSKVLQNS